MFPGSRPGAALYIRNTLDPLPDPAAALSHGQESQAMVTLCPGLAAVGSRAPTAGAGPGPEPGGLAQS